MGITYIYGKVSDLCNMAYDMQDLQSNNLDRQTDFIRILGSFITLAINIVNLILISFVLAIVTIICSVFYSSNNTAKIILDNCVDLNSNSYHGWLWGVTYLNV